MTTKADSDRVHALVFGYLSAMSDPTAVKMKDIRNYLETNMQLPEGTFKEGGYRQLLEVSASKFYSQQQSVFANAASVSAPAVPTPAVSAPVPATSSSSAVSTSIPEENSTNKKKATKKVDVVPPPPPPPQLTVPPVSVSAASNDKEGVMGKKRNRKVDVISSDATSPVPPPTNSATTKTVILPPGSRSSEPSVARNNRTAAVEVDADPPGRGRKKTAIAAPTASSSSSSSSALPATTSWSTPTGVGQVEIKKGKFSFSESALVREEMEIYVSQLGMELNQLCPYYYDKSDPEHSKKKRHSELWSRLTQILPHRSTTAIYQHGMRLILNEDVIRGPFTAEEKMRLEQLVETHGRNFVEISKEMGRRPDDCKQMLIKLQRKKTGRFSYEEDKSIFAAIRAATGIKTGLLPQQLEIPWTTVTNLLGHERTALDYHRRFLTVSHLHYQQNYPEGDPHSISEATVKVIVDPATQQQQHTVFIRINDQELTRQRIRLLEYLQELGAEDETELIWSDVDRHLNFYNNASSLRWKLMLKECPHNSDEVSTFQDKVSFLLHFYRDALESGRSLRSRPGPKRKYAHSSSVEFPEEPSNKDIFGDSSDDSEEEEEAILAREEAQQTQSASSSSSSVRPSGMFVDPAILDQEAEEVRIQEQLKHPKKRKLVENREAIEARNHLAEAAHKQPAATPAMEDVIDINGSSEDGSGDDNEEEEELLPSKKSKKDKKEKKEKKDKKSKKDKKEKKAKKQKKHKA